MFQYLPHRRRLCDEPYQVHPPAAPAALERKHPVDARQQLRFQLVIKEHLNTPWAVKAAWELSRGYVMNFAEHVQPPPPNL